MESSDGIWWLRIPERSATLTVCDRLSGLAACSICGEHAGRCRSLAAIGRRLSDAPCWVLRTLGFPSRSRGGAAPGHRAPPAFTLHGAARTPPSTRSCPTDGARHRGEFASANRGWTSKTVRGPRPNPAHRNRGCRGSLRRPPAATDPPLARLCRAGLSAFLAAFIVVPAPMEHSLGNHVGELARHRSGSVEGLVAEAPGGIDALCSRLEHLVPRLRGPRPPIVFASKDCRPRSIPSRPWKSTTAIAIWLPECTTVGDAVGCSSTFVFAVPTAASTRAIRRSVLREMSSIRFRRAAEVRGDAGPAHPETYPARGRVRARRSRRSVGSNEPERRATPEL